VDLKIIYEDKNFLAVNKPAGVLVHSIKDSRFKIQDSKEETLVDWLLNKYPEKKMSGTTQKPGRGLSIVWTKTLPA